MHALIYVLLVCCGVMCCFLLVLVDPRLACTHVPRLVTTVGIFFCKSTHWNKNMLVRWKWKAYSCVRAHKGGQCLCLFWLRHAFLGAGSAGEWQRSPSCFEAKLKTRISAKSFAKLSANISNAFATNMSTNFPPTIHTKSAKLCCQHFCQTFCEHFKHIGELSKFLSNFSKIVILFFACVWKRSLANF